ncbi:MAG: class I SAM-dependent methyltransferase [Acidobacteria bacterium]|nr:MAG: class I SAM-dependent methyltransferase [Acidobacteriota bacterium]
MARQRKPQTRFSRHEYKATWMALAQTSEQAMMSVTGSLDEDQAQATAAHTRRVLAASVGIKPDDVILEIGCGIGRVGRELAPRCQRWIGCDVSPNMLAYAQQRLAAFDNVELVEVSGFDLRPIPDASVDLVYCTVVFMHLDEWDRYNYVLEARRVLRPGGRIFVDNFNLCSDEGWQVFELHRQFMPAERPPQIGKSSTPQELETYLRRAGFHEVKIAEQGAWVQGYAIK